ncbi:MAG: flagellar biosynthesis regulator FlaF [Alphaproteobacteria bacterium]|nr:flagellar biosynthesis regulator FlaF [Alphaproteobacteria bacterium]
MSVKAYGSPYGKNKNTNLKPREIEARGLLEAAKRLSDALTEPENRDKMDQALDFHWQLWTLFQTEALGEDFPFSDEMRVLFLQTCRYIDRSILDFYADRNENMKHIHVFIDINRTLAQGFLQNNEASLPLYQGEEQKLSIQF